MHGPGGQIAIRGEKFADLLAKYGVFEGVNFYGEHLKEMLAGNFSRPWKRLAGFKFLYANAQREALVLQHWEGWSLAQIGDHLGRTPAAVAGLIKRGLKQLRQTLQVGD